MPDDGFSAVPEDLSTAASDVVRALDGVSGFALQDSGASAYGHDHLYATVVAYRSGVLEAVQVSARNAGAAGMALGVAARKYTGVEGAAAQAIGLFGEE